MSNRHSRHVTPEFVAALMLPMLLPLLLASPAMAKNNDHRFAQSLEGIRLAHENYCDRLKEAERLYEDLASDEAGTAQGDEDSAAAAETFAKAVDAGCKWAR